jgi:hypothetical protein
MLLVAKDDGIFIGYPSVSPLIPGYSSFASFLRTVP